MLCTFRWTWLDFLMFLPLSFLSRVCLFLLRKININRTLQQTQEITKQAHVVVQGGSHAGAALPPPPPSLELKKKAKAGSKAKGATPAPA